MVRWANGEQRSPVFRTVFFLRLKWSVSPVAFFSLTQINFLTTRSVTASFMPFLQTWGATNAITKKRTKQCKYENTTNVAIVSNRNQFVPDTAQKVNITPSQAEYNKSVHTWNGFLWLFPLLAVFGIIFFFRSVVETLDGRAFNPSQKSPELFSRQSVLNLNSTLCTYSFMLTM